MDNATHTLCGLALARAGLDRVDPRATATLVAASSLPDLDIVVQPFGGAPAYLCWHRGVTHALLGLFLQSLLLAALVWVAARRRPEPSRFRGLWLAAGVGLGTHLLLDGLNTYGIRPWLPFDGRWYYGDVAFIVDPWLWLCLGAAAALGAPPRADGRPRAVWGWVLFAVLALEVMLLQGRADAGPIPLVWAAGMCALIALRRRDVGAVRRRAKAWLGIAAALLYLGALTSCSRLAETRALLAAQATASEPVERSSCQPVPGRVHRFQVVVSTARRSQVYEVDLLRGRVQPQVELERHLDDPALPAVRATREWAAWRTFARHPFTARAEGLLILGDARYAPVARAGWCNLAVPLPAGAPARLTPTSAPDARPSPPR